MSNVRDTRNDNQAPVHRKQAEKAGYDYYIAGGYKGQIVVAGITKETYQTIKDFYKKPVTITKVNKDLDTYNKIVADFDNEYSIY